MRQHLSHLSSRHVDAVISEVPRDALVADARIRLGDDANRGFKLRRGTSWLRCLTVGGLLGIRGRA
jgi:hypothetical protein